MEIGSFVREQRRARNLTQKQLADKAGVGLNFVHQLEKNKLTVQLDCTRQVLQALGFDLAIEPTREFGWNAATTGDRAGAAKLPWD